MEHGLSLVWDRRFPHFSPIDRPLGSDASGLLASAILCLPGRGQRARRVVTAGQQEHWRWADCLFSPDLRTKLEKGPRQGLGDTGGYRQGRCPPGSWVVCAASPCQEQGLGTVLGSGVRVRSPRPGPVGMLCSLPARVSAD